MANVLEERLFSIIKKCYHEKFWESFDDAQLIALQLPKEKEPLFISIMGSSGDPYGFLIYRGYKQLAYLYQALNEPTEDGLPLQQNCLAIYFEDRENLKAPEYQRIKKSGITFRGRKAWPIIVDFTPGYLPSIFRDTHHLWLIHGLECLYDTAKAFRQDMSRYDREEIEQFIAFPGRTYDTDRKHEDRLFKVPSIYRQGINKESFGRYSLTLSDFEILRAQKLPSKAGRWEMDILPIQVPTDLGENNQVLDRPFYPFLFILADPTEQDILSLQLLKADDVEEFQRSFVHLMINKDYRPQSISIKDSKQRVYLYAYFSKLFEHLEITLHIQEELAMIDSFSEELTEMTFQEEES